MFLRKKTLWKLHSVLGLLTGVPLIIIAVTGSVLVFKQEIDDLLVPDKVLVQSSETDRLSFDRLGDIVRQRFPEQLVVGWLIHETTEHADIAYVVEKGTSVWRKIYVDAYSGVTLTPPVSFHSGFTDWLLELHYTFLGGHLGMLVAGILALGLCALGLTGILIYRRFWIRFFTLKWDKGLRVLSGDLHRKVGIVSAPLFFILGLTGAYWNITHAVRDLYLHGLGDEHEVFEREWLGPELSLDRLVADSAAAMPGYKPYYISFPQAADGPVVFYGQLDGRGRLRSQYGISMSFDRLSGESLGVSDIREANVAVQAVDAFRPLHFGNFGGLPVKLLYCVLGAMPGLLALSGFVVYAKRPKRKRVRRGGADEEAEPSAGELENATAVAEAGGDRLAG
ncbi:PepSY domain-containing protein [Sulfidibacter corallicola]|uniref:PepSY domain-containing protein n=1 Tax=Sulfidibacter corallicola TaxID=2818388 RepID=A0A8A4TF71_SULCO|nr:PepSY-associated TM helix domain-containing protein [Sulfidibacter corallicola]QTD48187.1 PepSY domain-containing protein [Sulfidibacter corallicola]